MWEGETTQQFVSVYNDHYILKGQVSTGLVTGS